MYIQCLNVVFLLFLCVQLDHSVVDKIQPHERIMFHWEQRYARVIISTTTTAAAAAAATTATTAAAAAAPTTTTSSEY